MGDGFFIQFVRLHVFYYQQSAISHQPSAIISQPSAISHQAASIRSFYFFERKITSHTVRYGKLDNKHDPDGGRTTKIFYSRRSAQVVVSRVDKRHTCCARAIEDNNSAQTSSRILNFLQPERTPKCEEFKALWRREIANP